MNKDLLNSPTDGNVAANGNMPYANGSMPYNQNMNGYTGNNGPVIQSLSGPDDGNAAQQLWQGNKGKQGGCGCRGDNSLNGQPMIQRQQPAVVQSQYRNNVPRTNIAMQATQAMNTTARYTNAYISGPGTGNK